MINIPVPDGAMRLSLREIREAALLLFISYFILIL